MSLRAALVLLVVAAAPALAQPPSPESFLGHPVGADRKVADYGQIVRYFEVLDRGSDRVSLVRLGKSTLGRDLVMGVITSESNLRQTDRWRGITRRLANPRGLSAAEAESLIARGKVVLLVTGSIHSTEIGACQMAMEWAYDLATSQDPKVQRWLDDVVLLLMPSINPDGTDIVVDWYRKYLGTPWEGGRLPWLYHHYAGHDDNRDWYMLNLAETRLVNRVLHHEWFPQVYLDEHQMGPATPRIFVPPYADPQTPLAHPLQWRLNDLFGTHMALRLEQAGRSGVIYSYLFDAYWPGGTKNTACLKNVVGLLTEVASCRVATPVFVDPNELAGGAKGLADYRPQSNFPNPWRGGWWRLRDIVDYELIASNSLLETCSAYRAEILRGFYEMGKDALRRGASEPPYAYVIPPAQRDPVAAARLVDILRENGLEAHRATEPIRTADGRRFEQGSVVFLAAQPYRPFLLEMMERQRYPEVRPSPDSKEILKPYDVTAWTLPLLMGVEWARVDTRFDAALEKLDQTPWPAGGLEGTGTAAIAIPAATTASVRLVNALLARGVAVERALEASAAEGVAAGDFLVPGSAAGEVRQLAAGLHVAARGLERAPVVKRGRLETPRIGLYKPWSASMDEGWTRFVLDTHDFKYASLDSAGVATHGLRSRFDAVILPDVDKNVLVEGRPKREDGPAYYEPLPPPYTSALGKSGVAALRAFVEQGGTLVCLGASCGLPLEEFNLPVRDIVTKPLASEISLPGTLVNLTLDPTHPLAFGMPERFTAYAVGGPAFATVVPGAQAGRSVVARYPEYADQVVASGWAKGTEHLTGRAAIVEARLGLGRVILFGPRVQYRGQTVGTYKLFFNALYLSAMR